MNSNRDEALRASDIAKEFMKQSNFPSALKFALKAKNMDPSIEKISDMITVCEVHCAAAQEFLIDDKGKKERDWYRILQVEPLAGDSLIKKQYKKLALNIHPDKNKFDGAAEAFKFVGEAYGILIDISRRKSHDSNRRFWRPIVGRPTPTTQPTPPERPTPTTQPTPPERPTRTAQPTPTPTTKKRPTASSTANNTPKRRNVIIDCSSSSESSSSDDDVQEEDVVILSDDDDDDDEGEKQKQKDDSPIHYVNYGPADFSNFDKMREKTCFQAGQMWAVYDYYEGMPRYYAIITEVRPVDFMVKYAWLEIDEDNEYERPNLPVTVGKFKVGDIMETNSCSIFSHLVCNSITIRVTRGRKLTIFPKKGETWALFKNWDILMKSRDSVSPSKYEYDFVEILCDYDSFTKKISVGFLSKVEGYRSVFCPMPMDKSCDILPLDFCRFSHNVPSFRLTGTEGIGVTEGWFELDTAALPV